MFTAFSGLFNLYTPKSLQKESGQIYKDCNKIPINIIIVVLLAASREGCNQREPS